MANSYVEYTDPSSGTNGLGQTTFTAPTKFLSINDIRVKGYNGSSWTELTITEPRGTTTVTLSAAPSAYSKIRVFRSSTTEALIDFQNGSRLAESDLDTAYRQSLFVAQEVAEVADPEGGSGVSNIVNSQLAGGITPDKLSAGAPSWNNTNNSTQLLIEGTSNGSGEKTAGIEINNNLTSGNGYAFIDFHTDSTTNPDYDARIFQNTNGTFLLQNKTNGEPIKLETTNSSGTTQTGVQVDGDGRLGCSSHVDMSGILLYSAMGSGGIAIQTTASGNHAYVAYKFRDNSGNEVGNITVNTTSTTFNTSSDYRLKENINYSFDATSRLKQLKPARFNFIVDADNIVDGFIAHEVSSIVPEAITGAKDATEDMKNVVLNADGTILTDDISEDKWTEGKLSTTDEDGNTVDPIYASDTTWVASQTVPKYQSIDQAKLVPLLVKTIQELEARITALETA